MSNRKNKSLRRLKGHVIIVGCGLPIVTPLYHVASLENHAVGSKNHVASPENDSAALKNHSVTGENDIARPQSHNVTGQSRKALLHWDSLSLHSRFLLNTLNNFYN